MRIKPSVAIPHGKKMRIGESRIALPLRYDHQYRFFWSGIPRNCSFLPLRAFHLSLGLYLDSYVPLCLSRYEVTHALASHKIKRNPPPVHWRTKDPYWFILSGIIMSTAIMSLSTALLTGKITAVVPIFDASLIFSMLLSILIFKRECLTSSVVLAVFMVVLSVIFIALNRQTSANPLA